jgi:hypothetical protein
MQLRTPPSTQKYSAVKVTRTQSGTMRADTGSVQLAPHLEQDPRVARSRPAGVVDALGQVLMFQDPASGASQDDAASRSPSPTAGALGSRDAAESKLHRFLENLLTQTSEELKNDLKEARDALYMAADRSLSMQIEVEQLEAIVSSHSPQTVYMSLRLMWTTSMEQIFENTSSTNSLSRNFATASKGIVTTIDGLVQRGRLLRWRHFRALKRMAGTTIVLLALRDATDALVNAKPDLSRSCEFAWLKVRCSALIAKL